MNRRERRRLKKLGRRNGADAPGAADVLRATLGQAMAALRAGQPRDALGFYRQVLEIDPEHADALNLSGIASFELGDLEAAFDLVRKAVAARPDHVDAHNNLGNLLKATGRLDEAEGSYRRALEIAPDYVGGHFNLGTLLEALERPGEAESAYSRALALDPGFAEAWLRRGNALKTLGRLHEAADAYRRALEIAPDQADAHNNLGTALREVGALDEAEAAYRRALEIAPRHLDAHYNLGIVLQEGERLDEAAAAYRAALAIDPTFPGAHVNLGVALQKAGRLDQALASYRRAIEIAPDYPGAQVNLGDALLERGDARAAAEACEAYLARHPGETSLLAWKTVLLQELGRMDEARELLDFDRFVQAVRLEAPEPFPHMAAFNAALADHVTRHPSLVTAPARHATRFGKHSGELLAEPKGPVAQLEARIRAAVESYLASHPAEPGHPFLAAAPRRFGLTAWAIVLEGQGHQVPHIHPSAWLSGVYYARLPESIARAQEGPAGWIEFGRPPEHFHCTAKPEVKLYRPEAGLMLLFPSYFYHRTLPFDSSGSRISISFDVLPKP